MPHIIPHTNAPSPADLSAVVSMELEAFPPADPARLPSLGGQGQEMANAGYRPGALGALLDEYEKALLELTHLIKPLDEATLTQILDPNTADPDCRSIQTVLAHVVRSGFCYAADIRKKQGETPEFPKRIYRANAESFVADLEKMFRYTEQVFLDYPKLPLESNDAEQKILTHWGQVYDVEQWLEHAIVHVLRHRRQIEKFILLAKGA